MGSFDKFLYQNVDFILFFAILEAIIIVFLVYNLKKRKSNKEYYKNDDGNVNHILKEKNKQIKYWKDAFDKIDQELNSLKNEGKRSSNRHGVSLSKLDNKSITPKEYEEEDNNPYSEYIKNEIKKGIYVKETPNDDGTVKRELYFDNLKDEPTSLARPKKYEYLEAANGGQFRKLLPSDEKSFFRTWEEDGVRLFEFHGNVDIALANINAIFDDVCEIEGKQNGATKIENLAPGTLTEQLIVDKPAKIRLT